MTHPQYLGWQIDKKVCTGPCGKEKSLSEFHNHKQGKFGKRSKCKTCYNEVVRGWKTKNPDKVKSATKKWRDNNKEQYRNTYNKWQASSGRAQKNAKEAARRAKKSEATPNWLSDNQMADIKAMYALAKKFERLCGVKYHVDHIIPLNNPDVCGLHVPWNLQVLPAKTNLKKSNKLLEV